MENAMKVCGFCGYESEMVCEGLGPRMGCEMPGQQPGYQKASPAQPQAGSLAHTAMYGDSPAGPVVSELRTLLR
jgi:hypothetical protein